MKFMETRRYEMLVRVRDFGAANGDRFPASTLAGKTFAGVSSTVNDLAGLAGTQLAAQGNADYGVEHKKRRRQPAELGIGQVQFLAERLGHGTGHLAVEEVHRVDAEQHEQRER